MLLFKMLYIFLYIHKNKDKILGIYIFMKFLLLFQLLIDENLEDCDI